MKLSAILSLLLVLPLWANEQSRIKQRDGEARDRKIEVISASATARKDHILIELAARDDFPEYVNFHLYLDPEDTPKSGFIHPAAQAKGATFDFLVENGHFHQYNGTVEANNWAWNDLPEPRITPEIDRKRMKIKLPLSAGIWTPGKKVRLLLLLTESDPSVVLENVPRDASVHWVIKAP